MSFISSVHPTPKLRRRADVSRDLSTCLFEGLSRPRGGWGTDRNWPGTGLGSWEDLTCPDGPPTLCVSLLSSGDLRRRCDRGRRSGRGVGLRGRRRMWSGVGLRPGLCQRRSPLSAGPETGVEGPGGAEVRVAPARPNFRRRTCFPEDGRESGPRPAMRLAPPSAPTRWSQREGPGPGPPVRHDRGETQRRALGGATPRALRRRPLLQPVPRRA